eukprot:g19794.t1
MWGSCCAVPSTTNKDVVIPENMEDDTAKEVPYSPPISRHQEKTDFDKKKKARSTIVEVLDDAAPIVRNRINTVRSTHGDIETRVYTAKRGSAKSRGSAQSGRATTQSGRATTQSGRATTQSTATAGTDGTPPEPQRGSARTSAITQESEGGRGSTQTKRSSMQSRKSSLDVRRTHSSASAMILQGMGLDLRRRGRGSVISHHHGRVHEDFDLLESLGVGGFGEVFRAKRRKDGKLCAIKSVDIEKTDPEVFQRELDQASEGVFVFVVVQRFFASLSGDFQAPESPSESPFVS